MKGIIVQGTVVGRHIGACNKNHFLICAFFVAALLAIIPFGQRYLHNSFYGPFPIDQGTLASITDPEKRYEYHVTVEGDASLGTVMKEVSKDGDKEKVIAYYLAVSIADKTVLVRSRKESADVVFSGVLKRTPDAILRKIDFSAALDSIAAFTRNPAEKRGPELGREDCLSVMLDTTEAPNGGWVIVWTILLVGVLSCSAIPLKRCWNLKRHPSAVSLMRLGPIEELAAAIDAELNNGDTHRLKVRSYDLVGYHGVVTMTPSWLLERTLLRLDVCRLDDIVWIYSVLDQHCIRGVLPADKEYSVTICDRHGEVVSIDFKKRIDSAKLLVDELHLRLPWAYTGYSQELSTTWWSDERDMMIAAVDERREESGTSIC